MKREFQLHPSTEEHKYCLYEDNHIALTIHHVESENLILFYLPGAGINAESIRLVYPGTFILKEVVDLMYFEGENYYFGNLKKINTIFYARNKINIRELGSKYEMASIRIGFFSTRFYIDGLLVGKLIRTENKSRYTLQLEYDIAVPDRDLIFLHALAYFHYSVMNLRAY